MADCSVKFRPPAPFKITDKTKLSDWQSWQKSYKWYASEVNLNQQSHDVQLSAFKSLIGQEALEIYNTFSLLDIADVESVIKKFDEHFKPKINLILERLKLYRMFQKGGQSLETFLSNVTNQVDKCEFGSMRDDIILYKIVGGLADDDVRKALLTDPNLTCDKAIQICRASAASHFMSGKLVLGRKSEQKKGQVPPKKLDLIDDDKKKDVTPKISSRISKAVDKKSAEAENTPEFDSQVKKSVKALHKSKSEKSKCQETVNDDEASHKEVVPTTKTEETVKTPTKNKKPQKSLKKSSSTFDQKSDENGESKQGPVYKKLRNQLMVKPTPKADTDKDQMNSDVENASKQDPSAPEAIASQNEGSSDDGGDDWRDADYRAEDDDDDNDGNDDLATPASSAKKRLDASTEKDAEEFGDPDRALAKPSNLYHYYYKNADQKGHFPCDVCGQDFHTKGLLTIHRVSHSAEENVEPVDATEKKVGFPCDICGKVLTSKSGRFVHRMNHVTVLNSDLKEGEKPFKTYPCGSCDKVLASRPGRYKHRQICHNPGQTYMCYYCGGKAKFKQRLYLRRHIFKLHADLLGNKPKYFTCDECGYQTQISSNLKRHKYKHSVEKPLSCALCDYRCIVAHQMKMHMTTKHLEKPDTSPVSCSQCGMKFKNPNALKPHMLSHMSPDEREKHREELLKGSVYTHPCDYCGKVFTSKTGLKSHIYSHTGEKPFACNQCDYKSVQQSSLHTHIKLKHSEEKPFICSVCGYACKLKSTLTTHMTVHTGERPHACDICGSRFKQHGHLMAHKKTHTGEKPYVCDICGHRWAQEGNLRAHMKIHKNQSGDPSQYTPPRKRKKKLKNDPVAPEPAADPLAPEPVLAPPSAIPPWSEQVSTINPMECFPSLETPPPFHPSYPVHQGNPRPPAADCRYFQQRPWPNQTQNHNQVQNPSQHLMSIRPVALTRTEMQHPPI